MATQVHTCPQYDYDRVFPQARQRKKEDLYKLAYFYIAENSDLSLDHLRDHCLKNIGCDKKTFSEAVQVYINLS